MKIAIGSDHAAIPLKDVILGHIKSRGFAVTDLGAKGESGADYPKYAKIISDEIVKGEYDLGVLLCGTGAGMCISANKVRGIRAVVCSDTYTARLSREHNNAQVLCLGARVLGAELAKEITDAFLNAKFLGERHQTRVDMIMAIEGSSI